MEAPMSEQSNTKRRKSSSASAVRQTVTVGVDLGDRKCHICIVDAKGEIVKEEATTTSPAAFRDYFKKLPTPTVVAIEVGPHSRWVNQVIIECGHDAIVANATKVKSSSRTMGRTTEWTHAVWLVWRGSIGIYCFRSTTEQQRAVCTVGASCP
jgi:hypothetical protein